MKHIALIVIAIMLAVAVIAIDNPFVTEVAPEVEKTRVYRPIPIEQRFDGYQRTINGTELQPAVVER